jgi:hypothetical protein
LAMARTFEECLFAFLAAIHLVQQLIALLVLEESLVDIVVLDSLQTNSHVVYIKIFFVVVFIRI